MPDYFRGYEIEEENDEWFFADTHLPVQETWQDRPCGHCGLHNTPEGHDGCLGTLPGVMNACCGHGQVEDAYVQFDHANYDNEPNKFRLGGIKAIVCMEKIK